MPEYITYAGTRGKTTDHMLDKIRELAITRDLLELDRDELQHRLDSVANWARAWQLQFPGDGVVCGNVIEIVEGRLRF